MSPDEVSAWRRLHDAAAQLDQWLTNSIGTSDYPDAATSLHLELRLAAYDSAAALKVIESGLSKPAALRHGAGEAGQDGGRDRPVSSAVDGPDTSLGEP